MPSTKLNIAINLAENDAGKILELKYASDSDSKYLWRQSNGLKANLKYAEQVLIRNNQKPKLHFYFSDKLEVNAYISRLRTKELGYVIICYQGTYNSMLNLFQMLLESYPIPRALKIKNTNVFANLSLAAPFVENGKLNLTNLAIKPISTSKALLNQVSKSKNYEYSLLLTSLGIEFLFSHELTHLDHGHLDYLKAISRNFNTIYSTDKNNNTPGNKNFTKALEFEADIGAAEFLFDGYYKSPYKGTMMRKFGRFIKSDGDLLLAIFYSLIWLFHIVEDFRQKLGANAVSSHPSPGCRILAVFRIFTILAERKGGDLNIVKYQFNAALEEYETICTLLKIESNISRELFGKNSSVQKEILLYDQQRIQVLEKLREFQFGRDI